MIPNNMKKEHILRSIEEIDARGVPPGRQSTKFRLSYRGKEYPPKYVISLAHRFANGTELSPSLFSGGEETNDFLTGLGFRIVGSIEGQVAPVLRGPSRTGRKLRDKQWGDSKKTSSMCPTELTLTRDRGDQLAIATVTVRSSGKHNNEDRTGILAEVLDVLNGSADVVLLPAGFYKAKGKPAEVFTSHVEDVRSSLRGTSGEVRVCFGIDGRGGKDQIAVAVGRKGIIAAGRKFHPTTDEAAYVEPADSPTHGEERYSRIMEVKGRRVFLAVCYDGFGIRQRGLKNPGVDLIFDLVHEFRPPGEDGSGAVYFAKHGFAGSSKQWGCPTFGAAVFFNCDIPPAWPTGVVWNQGNKSTQRWRYSDNPLKPIREFKVKHNTETGIVRLFFI